MRLILMGTGPFGVPTFRRLYETDHEIVAVVTQPLRPTRGRQKAQASPVRSLASEHGTTILDPESVNTDSARETLRQLAADLLVVCDFGQILSAETLATAQHGGINLHASLLPRYRGAAPINWAIYDGERETGVSIIHMTPRVDAGPVIGQARTPIEAQEAAPELEVRLADLGAQLVPEIVDAIERGEAAPVTQDATQASKAPRLKPDDGKLDWSRPAAALRNQVRAMQPWPRAHTEWTRQGGKTVRLVVGPMSVIDSPDPEARPGAVLETGERLVIAAGEGTACVLSAVQPAGKKMLPAADFLRGNPLTVGETLG